MAYIGLEFQEIDGGGVALVHKTWLTPRKKEVWWPPFKQTISYNKSLKNGEAPNEQTWKLYKIHKTFFSECDYEKALINLKRTEITSDVQSDANHDETQVKKRKVVQPKRLSFEYLSSDEDDYNCKRSFFPLPEKGRVAELIQNKSNKPGHLTEQSSPSASFSSSFGVDCLKYCDSNGTPTPCDIGTPTPRNIHHTDIDFNKKLLTAIITVQEQNAQILKLLLESKQTETLALHFDLPKSVPIKFPVGSLSEVESIEQYLSLDENLSSVAAYFSTLGGRDTTTKTNAILKNLLTSTLATNFSFLGTRNNKKSFSQLYLR